MFSLVSLSKSTIVNHDYDIIEPSETTSWKTMVQARTDIPSNITPPSVRTKSGRIIRKLKRYVEWAITFVQPPAFMFYWLS